MRGKLLVIVLVLAFLLSTFATASFAATENLFGTKSGSSSHESVAYELGTIFKSNTAGNITAVRVYTVTGETGNHTVRIWNNSTSPATVVAGPYTWSYTGNNTWKTYTLTTPLAIQANVSYTVVVSTGADTGKYYTYISGDLLNAGNNGNHLSWPANAGVYSTTVGARPTATYNGNNYLRDVVFEAAGGATPTPTPTSTPTPIPGGSWPDATNTGVPAGTQLTNTSGRTITTDNAIIQNENITGGLKIAAQNVTVRNCRITSSYGTGEAVNGTSVINVDIGASATIDHCTLNGSNRTHAGIWYAGTSLTATANNIYGTNDGIFVWDANNFTIQDNYLHGFSTRPANGHVDGFQTEGASHGIIRHNTFDVAFDQTSCVAIWNDRLSSDDILVDNNLMAGGGFSVYAQDLSPSGDNPAGGNSVTNIRFTNNAFSTVHYQYVGYYGVWFPRGTTTDTWVRTGNYVLQTGQNIDNCQPAGCPEAMPE